MKLSTSLLQAMLVAVTAGTVISCEKPSIDEGKKVIIETPKKGSAPENNLPECCPACGLG